MSSHVRFRVGVGRVWRTAGVGVALAVVMTIAGCSGSGSNDGGGSSKGVVGSFFQAGVEPKEIDPELIRPALVCPEVAVQLGTQSLRRTDGDGATAPLRWQASITKTARECRTVEGGTAVRVGVSGRVVNGPAGSAGRIELPLRIAVREGRETTYSKLHKVTVERAGASEPWAFVDEAIVVKNPRAAEILVGFDNG